MKNLLLTLFFISITALAFGQSFPAPGPGGDGEDEVRTENFAPGDGQPRETLRLFIPNAFTPNDDGINDEYYIQNSNFKTFEFSVFDRWGNQIFLTTNSEFRWDGKVGGKAVSSGI